MPTRVYSSSLDYSHGGAPYRLASPVQLSAQANGAAAGSLSFRRLAGGANPLAAAPSSSPITTSSTSIPNIQFRKLSPPTTFFSCYYRDSLGTPLKT